MGAPIDLQRPGRLWQAQVRMRKPLPATQPWRWKPLVRSRAVEGFWFAVAAGVSLLFLLGVALQGEKWLAAGIDAGALVAAGLALGLWNRRKRRRERAASTVLSAVRR